MDNSLIKRQDAIDALCSVCGVDCDKSKFVYGGKQEDQVILCPEHYVLTQLPSAQPERKKGKWIINEYGAVVCSECKWNAPRIMTGCLANRHLDYDKSDYCWHCGADMRGDQDENR